MSTDRSKLKGEERKRMLKRIVLNSEPLTTSGKQLAPVTRQLSCSTETTHKHISITIMSNQDPQFFATR